MKRALDLTSHRVVGRITAPVMLIVAVVVKRSSRGPAIFKQERVGEGGRTFRMWKFRTMYVASEDRLQRRSRVVEAFIEHDFKIPTHEDPQRSSARVRALRRQLAGRAATTRQRDRRIDEPGRSSSRRGRADLASYGDLDWAYLSSSCPASREDGRPTGQPGFPERAHLDADYLERWSLRTDLAILMKTIPIVVGSDPRPVPMNGSTATQRVRRAASRRSVGSPPPPRIRRPVASGPDHVASPHQPCR